MPGVVCQIAWLYVAALPDVRCGVCRESAVNSSRLLAPGGYTIWLMGHRRGRLLAHLSVKLHSSVSYSKYDSISSFYVSIQGYVTSYKLGEYDWLWQIGQRPPHTMRWFHVNLAEGEYCCSYVGWCTIYNDQRHMSMSFHLPHTPRICGSH